RKLGAGGMAVVYLARDLQRDRDVALKVLRPELGLAAGADRFDREIRLAARLVHPHILPVLDSGSTQGHLWYTMPFVEGETLRARLDREKQLPLDEAVRLTAEVADALAHAHAQGILHRDIKPENILLASGHALVADFGIARAVSESGDRLTSTGLALGTPGYMSPEQSTGERDLDARSDLYALASVSYEMLAGEPPFTGPTAQVVIARRLSQPAPSLRQIRPNIPESVDSAIQRALATVPADRFASTGDFAQALAAANSSQGITVATPPATPSKWPMLAAGAALLLGTILVFRFAGRSPAATAASEPATGGIRLAVLPFHLIGNDSEEAYLAEGITEEVNSALSNLGGLRVIDRSSVTPYANTTKTAREIGAALDVDALVSGDVQKVGDEIRVRVKLVEPSTEESKWSQTYDHTARDVFQVQSEVATRVAGVLRIQLAERESRKLTRPPTTNPEAYDAYLRAQALRRSGSVGDARANLDSVITELSRAVALDSSFASAWALLGSSLVNSVFLFDADAARLDQAEKAINTALSLDSTVAMAWKARHDFEWNAVRGWHFPEALADVRHALALQPSLVAAHNGLGSLYFHYGFMEQARKELSTSLSLDPRDSCDDPTRCQGFSRPRIARVLWYQQKFDSALAVYDQMPFVGGFVTEKAVVLNAVGRSAEGLAVLDSSATPARVQNGDGEAVRGLLYASLGNAKESLAHIQRAIARPDSRSHFHHAQFTIACAYARLGRNAEAVEWLRKAADNGLPNYPLFRNDPNLASLQGDPGYETFMAGLERQFEGYGKLVHADGTP
ncbi:MAG TPA: protein kinase, partial [Gemmatimonadales bacterium]|nr:protein kinase [Gemmatimonadales bacterium]